MLVIFENLKHLNLAALMICTLNNIALSFVFLLDSIGLIVMNNVIYQKIDNKMMKNYLNS